MPKFESPKHKGLVLQDDKGVWAKFEDGEFETSDASVAKRLRALPDDYEVTEAKAPAKADGDGSGKPAGGSSGDQK
ncbi:hypothetical protein ACH4ND_01505 [Streptomyces sp. NPDC017179]|uniref:hypothetical protein n=1 Tax=Streptomyces sp. NPDC017179 TaxID=3364979 RepID=UPI0037A3A58B